MDMPYRLLVGIDWATVSHQACVLEPDETIVREVAVEHRATEITAFADELVQRAGGEPAGVAVGIEVPRGGLVETLLERGFHIYALNPKQLDRFRDRHSVAGAKNDRLDAYVLADALRTDRPKFRRVEPDHPLVVQIRELSRADEDLRGEANRLVNRLRGLTHRCAPRLLSLCPSADEPWFWELVERTAGPRPWKRVGPRRIEQLLKRHRIRRLEAEDVYAVLREPSLDVAPGAVEATRRHVGLLLPRLRVVYEQRKECKKQLKALLEEYAQNGEDDDGPGDLAILRSLPGVGPTVSAILLSEAAHLLARRDGATLRAYGGLAPVTRQSGKTRSVVMRRGCNLRLRNAFYHWARVSTTCDPAARDYYDRLRARGHTHGRALRSVADRWVRICMAMLRDGTYYSTDHGRAEAAA